MILVAVGLFLFVKVISSFRSNGKGALQITSSIKSTVFLDGKKIGITPLCKCEDQTIKAGEYDIRLEPSDTTYAAYSVRVRVNRGVLTAVDRTFLPGSLASAYTLTLEESQKEKPQLLITSIPEGAMVTIDSAPTSATPYLTDTLSASEHEIEIQKQGFAKKTIRIRAVANHKLIVTAFLGTQEDVKPTAELTKTPTITTTIIPTPSVAAKGAVTILPTPNGFLRVRNGAGTSFDEVGRVNTGQTFDILDEQSGWIQIKLTDGTTGWVSSAYAKKN